MCSSAWSSSAYSFTRHRDCLQLYKAQGLLTALQGTETAYCVIANTNPQFSYHTCSTAGSKGSFHVTIHLNCQPRYAAVWGTRHPWLLLPEEHVWKRQWWLRGPMLQHQWHLSMLLWVSGHAVCAICSLCHQDVCSKPAC